MKTGNPIIWALKLIKDSAPNSYQRSRTATQTEPVVICQAQGLAKGLKLRPRQGRRSPTGTFAQANAMAKFAELSLWLKTRSLEELG